MSDRRDLASQLADFMVDATRVAGSLAREADRWLEATRRPGHAAAGGPPDVDAAVSEWANRTLRRLASPHLGRPGPRGLLEDLAEAFTASRPRDLEERWWTLPASLPLAFAGLLGEQFLRAEAVVRTQRPAVLPGLAHFVAKTWSDLPIYFTLQYGHALEHLRGRLDEDPGDADLRFAFASTLLECGLFREAAEHFEALPGGDGRAHHWAMVARLRAGDVHEAVEHGAACLLGSTSPEPTSRLWMHLALEALDEEDPARVAKLPEEHRLTVFSRGAECDLELEEVSAELGLEKTSGGRGTAIADVTGDDTLDVMVAGAHSGISLYLNRGDGTFEDASAGSGLDACVYAFGLAAGDFTGDGHTDLFVTGLGFFDGQGMLLRGRGDGTFEDVTHDAGLDLWGPGFTASWVDFDGDGWLDLYVVNNLGGLFDRKTPNRLFRNNRDGTFEDVTRDAGLDTPWPSLGHCWGDFTGDGLPDLFVSNFGRAQLFANRGDGTFEDVSRAAGVDLPAIGSVAFAADLDHDGNLDIVQLTYSRPEDALHTLEHGHAPRGGAPPRVFENRGDGTFEQAGEAYGFDGAWGTMSANLGDLGNRGRFDLALGNGDPAMDRVEPTVLYRQGEDGRFRDVTGACALPLWGKGHGVNFADLAGDGRQHLLVGHGGLYPGDLMRTTVHRPRGEVGRELGHYLGLRLRATTGHPEARGARIRVTAGGRDRHFHVSAGTSFGCLPLEQHVGLGDAERVEEIHIRWPGGHGQTLRDLAADQVLTIVEDAGGPRHGAAEVER